MRKDGENRENTPREREVRAMLEEEQRESEEFFRILERARDPACPPEELYGDFHAPDIHEQAEPSSRPGGMDRQGNPTWIRTPPLERDARYDSLDRDRLPEQDGERNGSFLSKRFRPKALSSKGETVSAGLEAGERGTGRRSGRDRNRAEDLRAAKAVRERQGRGTLTIQKPRPLRGLVRILLVCAALGLLYHFLAGRGWVPKLF